MPKKISNNSSTTTVSAYEELAIKTLKARGYRITMPRVQVIRALADTTVALSAYAIHEKIVSGGGKIDVVSVYRILRTLQECRLVTHIGIVDGYYPLSWLRGKCDPIIAIVDSKTGSVELVDTPLDLRGLIMDLASKANCVVDEIKIEISGSVGTNLTEKA